MENRALTLEERESILNREIDAFLAVNPRTRTVLERTQTTAHLHNKIRESFLYLSVLGCLFTLGISLLIDIPIRIVLRLMGRKIHDHVRITVQPDGTVIKTPH